MKTNTLNVILASIALSTVALIAVTKLASSHFEMFPIVVSYTAVAILAALTLSDYRSNAKGYSAR
jgi:hypothetical protein